MAKRKLILRYMSTFDEDFSPRSEAMVFIKNGKEKGGKQSGIKVVIELDKSFRIVSVRGANGQKIRAGIEDIPPDFPKVAFLTLYKNQSACSIEDLK